MVAQSGSLSPWRLAAAVGYLAAAGVLVALFILKSETAFRIDARTETALIAVADGPAPSFRLEGARVLDLDGAELAACTLLITPGARQLVTITRYAASPVALSFDSGKGGAPAQFACADGSVAIDAAKVDVIEAAPLKEARQAALFVGVMTLGDVPRDGGGRFAGVLDGDVTMVSSSVPTGAGQSISAHPLRAGDQLTLYGAGDVPAAGFSTVLFDDEAPGFQVVHQAQAVNAKISRYGGSRPETSLLAPSLFARLQANALWAIIPLLFGFISSAIAQVITRR